MIKWIVIFFLLAVVASILGFTGIAGTFMGIAKFLAVVFMILFVITIIIAVVIGKKITD